MHELTWVEISREALTKNIQQFRQIVGEKILCPCVKANAYGHGLIEAGKIFVEAGADWLSVNSIYEAIKLRQAGVEVPIYILGYVGLEDLEKAVNLDCRLVVYNRETVEQLGLLGNPVKVHLKVETGNNRQGIYVDEVVEFASFAQSFSNIELEGISTHFANIEDTTDHSYAEKQLAVFNDAYKRLEAAGIKVKLRHCANSAATILFPKTHFEMVRAGIANYGMWPSNETYVSFVGASVAPSKLAKPDLEPPPLARYASYLNEFQLTPAFTWKTKVAQIKTVPAGEYIGYGCTYKTGHDTRLAILPVGYYDGYDRGINGAHVLINGKRAPIRGRICMNIVMVEVTDIPEVQLENEVVLIGRSGDEEISAEQFASWAGTINYEVTTRVNERIPRVVV